jgi:soluble lytic murein transglycosylase
MNPGVCQSIDGRANFRYKQRVPTLRSTAGALLGLMLCACSTLNPPPATPVPSITPSQTATFTPTATITPTPTVTPTPEPVTRVQSGDDAFRIGDYDQAGADYQAAIDNSADPDIRSASVYGLGRIQHARGDDVSAITSFQTLLDNYPTSPHKADAYFWLGQIYDSLKRNADAADAYAQYLALRPGVIDAYVQELRGDALVADGNDEDAITAYQAAAAAPRLGDANGLNLKIGQAEIRLQQYPQAIDLINGVYTNSTNDYTRADADLFAGQAYLAQNNPDLAKERFLDAVTNFPRAYSAYAALLLLVQGGLPVSDVSRGEVDYYAGQYQVALVALQRAIDNGTDTDGTALYFKGLTLVALEDYPNAVAAWDEFIQKDTGNPNWVSAWEDRAFALWADLNEYDEAAKTLLDFVQAAPNNAQAPTELFEAGRIYERENKLDDAAAAWERLVSEYPTSDDSFRGLFLAGICRYRQGNLSDARLTFERAFLLATAPADKAAASLWIGKAQKAQGQAQAAEASWQQAASLDPTGYYSVRAQDLLSGRAPFAPPAQVDFGIDQTGERADAEKWLRSTFALESSTDLNGLGSLAQDPHLVRGIELWRLGLYAEAEGEFEALRETVKTDVVSTYRLMNYLYSLGLYRSAIFASRQVLTLAHLDDAASLSAPAYFNHIRFGEYYRGLILPAADQEKLNPLLLLSVIRQESMFESFVSSGAGAVGLMQIMPATGQGIVSNLGWPPYYTDADLTRAPVSIRLGAHYLAQQRDGFDGDLYAALAAYNGGPGNASAWLDLANGDPDLFLEVVRIQETRTYIMNIYEIYAIYRQMYSHS